jgi:hypothetical protein
MGLPVFGRALPRAFVQLQRGRDAVSPQGGDDTRAVVFSRPHQYSRVRGKFDSIVSIYTGRNKSRCRFRGSNGTLCDGGVLPSPRPPYIPQRSVSSAEA